MLIALKDFFNCETIKGAYFENSYPNFYLERTYFRGEVMSAGLPLELTSMAAVSKLTKAWLLDTGWFFNINT